MGILFIVDGDERRVGGPTAALSGLRVLDLSTHATGPFATQILASLGAAVLKVERPPAGDPERHGEYAMFLACNRGKYSVALDVKDAADRHVLEDLAREADAFVEGFRPGVAERMGFGFERVRELQPRVIYVSLPGFGSTGPRASMRGYDTQYRALAGDLWLNAGPGGIPHYNPASPSFDYATAMYAAIGVLSVLVGPREEAVHIEVPILAAGLAWSFARLIDPAYADGRMASVGYVFRTLDDEYVAINAGADAEFIALCEAIGRPDLHRREDLRDAAQRRGLRAEIDAIVAEAIAGDTLAQWQERLAAYDVPYAPVLKPGRVTGEPQVRELGVVHGGDEPHAELPIFGLPRRSLRRVPSVDEHGTLVREGGWAALEREDVR
jgi:crotonobetainyl-CoA:carnitine CoA-transferase CaiB-like acyl-CoA transferase